MISFCKGWEEEGCVTKIGSQWWPVVKKRVKPLKRDGGHSIFLLQKHGRKTINTFATKTKKPWWNGMQQQ